MSLKKNVIANYLGQGWVAIMGVAFTPLYINYLGMESYGLIGIFAILQASLMLFDLGMTPTLNREMARYTAGAHTAQTINDLLRSLELICFFVALVIGFLIFFSSQWLASEWLQVKNITVEKVSYAVSIMGIVVALRFIESLYRSAVLGLQKHVLFNLVNGILSTMRGFGVLGVLEWGSPTVEAFFLWQSVVSVVAILTLKVLIYRLLPRPAISPTFSSKVIMRLWRFAGGMMVTTLLSLILFQTDKLFLSRLLSLEAFGYYTFAASVSGSLYFLAAPIAQTFSPRFTELVTLKDDCALNRSYHQAAQLINVIVMPAALVLIFFAESVIMVWANNSMLAKEVSPIIQVLAIGGALNALMYTPYMMQLGYGWVSFSVKVNSFAVALFIPLLLFATPHYGAIGAAWCWALLNLLNLILATHFMHKKILVNEKWTWYKNDILLPLFSGAFIVIISWLIHPSELPRLLNLLWLLLTGVIAFLTCLFASNILRNEIYRWLGCRSSSL